MLLTACQVRAARAMMRMSLDELARRSGVSKMTIKRVESQWGTPNVRVDTLIQLIRYFESEGFSFIPETGDATGPGVCWGRYPGRRNGNNHAAANSSVST